MYDVEKLRFWCQKIIPLVYDDSLSYYELLCKVVYKLNELVENVNGIPDYIANLISEEGLREIMETLLVNLESQIASANEGESETATDDRAVGTLVWLNGYLYRATKFIDAGDKYVVNGNVEKITIEEVIKGVMLALTDNYENGERVASEDREAGELVWFNNQLLYIKADIVEGNAYTDLNSEVVDFSKLFKNIHDDITSEATARAEADTALGQRITDEATARDNADTAIINSIVWVSPKRYGAVGDGVTDDTSAIQNCINENSYVVLDGDFLITEPITLHSNMYVLGKGSIVNTTEFTTSLYAEEVTNLVIDGVSFVNGERSGSAYTKLNGNIHIYNSNNILIRNIKDTEHNKMASILLDTVTNFEITSCLIIKGGYAGVMCYGNCHFGNIHHNEIEVDYYTEYPNTYAIALSCSPHSGSITDKSNQCSDIIIDSNIVYTYNNQGFWEGIDSHAGTRIKIVNNKVKGFAHGIVLTRVSSYTGFDTTPTYCEISGNDIVGPTSIASVRTELVGIGIYGNENIFSNCSIKNNRISEICLTQDGVDIGCGVVASGQGIIVDGNTFHYAVCKCIELRLSSLCSISNNTGIKSVFTFIEFNDIRGEVIIKNNLFVQARNFYLIKTTNGLGYVTRSGNNINNAYWMDNTPFVTNITDFVPDYVNTSPAGSNYHPRGMVAIKSVPASGSPEKWVCNGTTWVASANLV